MAMPRRLLLLLPLLPALWNMRAIVRSLQRSHEFERMVQLEALTVGFLGMLTEPNRFNQVAP